MRLRSTARSPPGRGFEDATRALRAGLRSSGLEWRRMSGCCHSCSRLRRSAGRFWSNCTQRVEIHVSRLRNSGNR